MKFVQKPETITRTANVLEVTVDEYTFKVEIHPHLRSLVEALELG